MANAEYYIGQRLRWTVTVTNAAGSAVDPSGGVTITVQDPSGAETTPGVTNAAVGTYYAEFTGDAAGTWKLRAVSVGDQIGALETYFDIRESLV